MKREDLHKIESWLSHQLVFVNAIIEQAQKSHNYGREIQYKGMRDAYMCCLDEIRKELGIAA